MGQLFILQAKVQSIVCLWNSLPQEVRESNKAADSLFKGLDKLVPNIRISKVGKGIIQAKLQARTAHHGSGGNSIYPGSYWILSA